MLHLVAQLAVLAAAAASRPVLRLYGSKPDSGGWPVGLGVVWGADRAVGEINTNQTFSFDINISWFDDMCTRKEGMRALIQRAERDDRPPLHGVIGSGCSGVCMGLHDIAPIYGLVSLSWGCSSPQLAKADEYPYFARTSLTGLAHSKGLVYFMKHFGLKDLGVIVQQEESGIHLATQEALLLWMEENEPSMRFVASKYITLSLSMEQNIESMRTAFLEATAVNVRVFLLQAYEDFMTLLMCAIVKSQVPPSKLVLSTFGWVAATFVADQVAQLNIGEMCSLPEMNELTRQVVGADDRLWDLSAAAAATPGGLLPRELKDEYDAWVDSTGVGMSDYSALLYDAVYVWAKAAEEYLQEAPDWLATYDHKDSSDKSALLTRMHALIMEQDFPGASGQVRMDGIGERISAVSIVQGMPVAWEVKGFCEGGGCVFTSTVNFGLNETWDPSEPDVYDDRVPLDKPTYCALPLVLEDPFGDVCIECPTNSTYIDEAGTCLCDPGFSTVQSGPRAQCTMCEEGTVAFRPGSASCELCALGKYIGTKGNYECNACPVGRFADVPGRSVCTSCGANSSTPDAFTTVKMLTAEGEEPIWTFEQGSTSNTTCSCDKETRTDGAGGCMACGEGVICNYMDDISIEAGYFSEAPDADGNLSVFICHGNTLRCKGGPPGQTCMPGRVDLTCAECEDMKNEQPDGSCAECGGGDEWVFALACVIVIVLISCVYVVIERQDMTVQGHGVFAIAMAGGIAITTMQQFGILASFNMEWESPMKEVFKFMRIFVFDIETLRLTCVMNTRPLARFVIKVNIMIICGCILILIHVAFVIGRRGASLRSFAAQNHVLLGVIGALMMVFYISIITTILAPFQCLYNPNGKRTARTYQSVVCWEAGEHQAMIGIGVVAALGPLVYLAICANATLKFPKKVLQGDTNFLRAFAFLFTRYHPSTYMFGFWLMLRSLLLSLIVIIPFASGQVFLAQSVMLVHFGLVTRFSPWRIDYINLLDGTVAFGNLLVLGIAGMLIPPDDDVSKISTLGAVILAVMILCMPFFVAIGAYKHFLNKLKKPFGFFICHHKAGAGSFARLLKMLLLEKDKTKKVFVDTDDLRDLDLLFEYVGRQTETLIILCTREILMRQWCIGEIVTASRNNVRSVRVINQDFTPPTTDFMENYIQHNPDIKVLTQTGMTAGMIKDALYWLGELPSIQLRSTINLESGKRLAQSLVRGAMSCDLPTDVGDTFQDQSDTMILVDHSNFEAVATALVLSRMLIRHFTHNASSIPTVLPRKAEVPDTTEMVLLICTPGAFVEPGFVTVLAAAAELETCYVPILASNGFRFPTPEMLREWEASYRGHVADPAHMVETIREVLKSIMTVYQPADYASNESILQAQAQEVADRVTHAAAKKTRKFGRETTSNKTATPASSVHTSDVAESKSMLKEDTNEDGPATGATYLC